MRSAAPTTRSGTWWRASCSTTRSRCSPPSPASVTPSSARSWCATRCARPPPDLRSISSRPPLDLRSTSARPPLHLRSTSAPPPLDLRSISAPPPLDLRSTSARLPLHLRSTSARSPLDLRSISARPPSRPAPRERLSVPLSGWASCSPPLTLQATGAASLVIGQSEKEHGVADPALLLEWLQQGFEVDAAPGYTPHLATPLTLPLPLPCDSRYLATRT